MNFDSNKARNLGITLFILILSTAIVSAPAQAQVSGATLSGTVTDSSGGILANAKVDVNNVGTGLIREVESDSAGFYSVPNLLPGDYELTISAAGFKTEIRRGITLTVGLQQVLNVSLQLGATTQRVEVTGAAPDVEVSTSDINSVVDSKTVVDLPLNGRDWTSLAVLQPAVNAVLTQQPNGVTASRANRGFGTQLSISGTRPQLNNYRLDGISIVDYAGGAPGSVLGIALGVDAIEEFSVLTANASAAYGRTAGGVINAITRTGTNQFHGNVYEFLRNNALDAKNFFDRGSIPPFKRNQFGASGGGPIQKDKTFFFADYEGFRQTLGTTNVDLVPSADARNGIIHNSDGTTSVVSVSPLVTPFLAFYPLPNAGLVGLGNTGHYDIATTNVATENFVTVKIDRKFSEKDSIAGTWFWDKGLNDAPDSLNEWVIGNRSFRTMTGVEETHVFNPAFVNSMRGGFNRVSDASNFTVSVINPLVANTTPIFSAFPGEPPPGIKVTGLTTFNGGPNALSAPIHTWNSFQAYDDGFLTKGAHSIKFGFAFERMQHNFEIAGTTDGNFNFGSLSNFLIDQPSSFTGAVADTIKEFGVRQDLFAGYVQDDWRWRHNVTFNIGLRYEMVTVPAEVHNNLTNLRDLTTATPFLGSPLFNNPTLHNFEPRVGFAWDPFGNGKTSVRGAFGIFDLLPFNYEFFVQEGNSNPFEFKVAASNLPVGSFPGGVVSLVGVNPATLQNAAIEFNPHRNYLEMWNLNIEHQFTQTTTLMVGYVGNHGVHMENKTDDANMVIPTLTPSGYLWPDPVGSGTRINPAVGQIRLTDWGGTALYDALEARLSKRFSHGFQAQGSYTFGKGIDTGSASVIGDPFTNSITSLLFFCNACRRGPTDFNITHTLTVNYLWDLPTPGNWGTLATHVLGGWQLGGITTVESGLPFTPLIGGDPLGQKNTDPFDYPSRVAGCGSLVNAGNPNNYVNLSCFTLPTVPAGLAAQCTPFAPGGVVAPGTCSNLMGNVGRNSVVGPGLVNFDFSLFKNNYIRKFSENFNVQFRAEFFNIFNRANFAVPTDNSKFFDQNGNSVGGAGSIDQTSTPAREIQFGLKVIW
jgi:Carboxypeptidase regulatory-like domain/TonB-dependent Receptor Plug Domain/TonB dependent receptor